ncbi:hypothetical protein NQ038_10765 [Brevibacterium sp. 50QC2O2]|uniref:hypothetical protein n=1 Tax=Brevibacterium sp. 50QC2O2 TaxID=2968459 RepID=UPI00211D0764|nr:hypothetical protein [Brevibacterium sp. 50QC2O2]MCQ9389123.1 hypothetical protein [Brevibacterium sp. 50QC2O2]
MSQPPQFPTQGSNPQWSTGAPGSGPADDYVSGRYGVPQAPRPAPEPETMVIPGLGAAPLPAPPSPPEDEQRAKRKRLLLIGVFALVAVVLIASGLGYLFGHGDRKPQAAQPAAGAHSDSAAAPDDDAAQDDSESTEIDDALRADVETAVNDRLRECMKSHAGRPKGCPQEMTATDWALAGKPVPAGEEIRSGVDQVNQWSINGLPDYEMRRSGNTVTASVRGLDGQATYPNNDAESEYDSSSSFTLDFDARVDVTGDNVGEVAFTSSNTSFSGY